MNLLASIKTNIILFLKKLYCVEITSKPQKNSMHISSFPFFCIKLSYLLSVFIRVHLK